jgi:hypothetical protein
VLARAGDKLAEVRAKELKLVRKQRFMSAFLSVFMTTQTLLLTVTTFSVYAARCEPPPRPSAPSSAVGTPPAASWPIDAVSRGFARRAAAVR